MFGRVIHSMSWCAGSWGAAPAGYDLVATAAWPTTNKALFVPFTLNEEAIVYALGWINGATVGGGSYDAGLYHDDGARIVSTGSTLQAGASQVQAVDVADTVLKPGNYFLGMAGNATLNNTVYRVSMAVVPQVCLGVKQQAAGFVLPSSATLVDVATTNYYPLILAFTAPVY